MKFRRSWLLFGLFLLIYPLLGADSCSGSGNSGTQVTGTPSAVAPPKAFKVGDVVKVGDQLLFTVTAVASNPGTEFEKPAKGQYLIVSVLLTNNGKSAANVSSALSFELRDDGGTSYTETILSTAPKPPDGSIAVGDKLAGGLTFDVPTGKTFKLYYKNDVFSGGQVIVELGAH